MQGVKIVRIMKLMGRQNITEARRKQEYNTNF